MGVGSVVTTFLIAMGNMLEFQSSEDLCFFFFSELDFFCELKHVSSWSPLTVAVGHTLLSRIFRDGLSFLLSQ